MKLATYKDGSRDGQLLLVSRDLTMAHYATGIANTLQQALEDWNFMSPQLQDMYDALNQGRARHAFAFDPAQCMAPLPRAYQCLDASAFIAHRALLHQASGAVLPENWANEPQLCVVDGAHFAGAYDPIVAVSEQHGIDFSAQISVITGDIAQAASPSEALAGIRLLMLANGIALRQFRQSDSLNTAPCAVNRPMTAFSPVAITPDELGEAWQQGRLGLTLQCAWNERKVGLLDAAARNAFRFWAITFPCRTNTPFVCRCSG